MLFCEGRAFFFGDDINTDYIISSRYKRDTLDPALIREYIMVDIRPEFYHELQGKPAIIVAGHNFGCGSAMEVAAQILPANNIHAVIAKSFARSYYRNCVNNGVLPIEIGSDYAMLIEEEDYLSIELTESFIKVSNISKGSDKKYAAPDLEMQRILMQGGVIPKQR